MNKQKIKPSRWVYGLAALLGCLVALPGSGSTGLLFFIIVAFIRSQSTTMRRVDA